MCNQKFTVVVDGSAGACQLGAFDTRGKLCATAANGPACLSTGEEQAWLHIRRGLTTLAGKLGEPDDWLPSVLYLGLSGALQSAPREQFLAMLPPSIEPILISDRQAQLLGATCGAPGACLAVGSGTVLHWLDETGEIQMAGGWGFPVGDEGSGAWLGVRLLNAYLWHRDTRCSDAKVPSVFQALERRIGCEVSEVKAWSINPRSTELESLVPIIMEAADQGDTLADWLLHRGAQQCDRLLSVAPETLPVYVVGELAEIYRPRLNILIQARLQRPQGSALSGLYMLSRTQRKSAL